MSQEDQGLVYGLTQEEEEEEEEEVAVSLLAPIVSKTDVHRVS